MRISFEALNELILSAPFGATAQDIAEQSGHTAGHVARRAKAMGRPFPRRRGRRWRAAENEVLNELLDAHIPLEDIAYRLGRSVTSVTGRIYSLEAGCGREDEAHRHIKALIAEQKAWMARILAERDVRRAIAAADMRTRGGEGAGCASI